MTDINKQILELKTHYEKSLGLASDDGRIIITETGAKFHDIPHMKDFPKTIAKHPNLKYLKIINCGIEVMPGNFNKLFKVLKNLDLTGNRLSTISTLNNNLKYLRLNNNQITSLPALPTSLLKFYVKDNKLTSLNLRADNKLTELFVGGNAIAQEPTNLNLANLELTDIPKKNWYEV